MIFVADRILSASAQQLFIIPGKVRVPLASHYKDTPLSLKHSILKTPFRK